MNKDKDKVVNIRAVKGGATVVKTKRQRVNVHFNNGAVHTIEYTFMGMHESMQFNNVYFYNDEDGQEDAVADPTFVVNMDLVNMVEFLPNREESDLPKEPF